MFTVDLLKGQGLPIKSRPVGIVISAIAIAVPIIIATAMLSVYLRDKIIISVQRQEIRRWETETGKYFELVKLQESFEKDKAVNSTCLAEVKSSIGRYSQWSQIIATVVENMPETVVLSELGARQRTIKKKVPRKDDPTKTTEVDVPARVLRVSVCAGSQSDGDEAVRGFQARLRTSLFLGPRLENITVSQESGKQDGQDIITYQIDCIFKPGL